MEKIVIIGIGNPILTDDSVGIKTARQLRGRYENNALVDVSEIYSGGIRLLDALTGYSKAIIIDAVKTKENMPGRIHRLTPDDIVETWNMVSIHDMNLRTALALGNQIGLHLPAQIDIWGIEGADLESFGEVLTEIVAQSVPTAIEEIIEQVEHWLECSVDRSVA